VLSEDLVSSARLRYLGTSAQKTRLVVDLIRGRSVAEAVATLRYTNKAVARELARLLDSAVANARQKRQDVDVDRLYVRTAFVDGGPMQKRIRPAPMGRAFRILKRTCHVTIGLDESGIAGTPVAPRVRTEAAATGEGAAASPARRPAKRPARSARPGGRAAGKGTGKKKTTPAARRAMRQRRGER
jgi:large subunit ribosomal protein L22